MHHRIHIQHLTSSFTLANFSLSKRISSPFKFVMSHQTQRRKSKATNYNEASYEISSDGVRSVIPYVHEFTTFAKGRWLGREILEVLTTEFGGHPREYWTNAIDVGHVLINQKKVPLNYIFKNSDALLHRTHRHEPPIAGSVTLVGENEMFVAINKPASLPVHPCGAYRFNSLTNILAKEPVIASQTKLHLVHRLDRVTSGLMILAKSKEFANDISNKIRSRSTKKTYLARVKGIFPKSLDKFTRMEYELFVNWRTEIGEEYAEIEDAEETAAPTAQATSLKRKRSSTDEVVDSVSASITADIPSPVDEVNACYASDRVAFSHDCNDPDVLYFKCPIGVISHRDGVHACRVDGKQSISSFKSLGYDVASDTSLVECGLFTGRTHQLRLHLEILGNPIANDPCYGGRLFAGDEAKRRKALVLLRDMRAVGYHPLSKVPHFDEEEFDEIKDDDRIQATASAGFGTNNQLSIEGFMSSAAAAANSKCSSNDRIEGESDDDYLVRTCRYCRDKRSYELESILHCDGIWLHALRYEGPDWCFEAPRPDWARVFT